MIETVCARLIAPWGNNSYLLVSEYYMLQFPAERYMAISSRLTSVIRIIERAEYRYERINDQTIPSSKSEVGEIKEDCQLLALESSVTKLEEIEKILDDSPIYNDLARQYKELYKCLFDEMTEKLCLFIPPDKQQFYLEPLEQFGLNVSRFESARIDIEEAGKSYATSRNTACVFHVMRVVEIGLNVLAQHLRVPAEHTNWETIMMQIQNKIHEIDQAPKDVTPELWNSDHRFYSEMDTHFSPLKITYRNYLIHSRKQYDEAEALTIYNHASSFMKHLAIKLSA